MMIPNIAAKYLHKYNKYMDYTGTWQIRFKHNYVLLKVSQQFRQQFVLAINDIFSLQMFYRTTMQN